MVRDGDPTTEHCLQTAQLSLGSCGCGVLLLSRLFSSRTSHKLPFLHYFDGSRSSTYQPTTTPWSIRYGKGEVAGVLSRDRVRLGRYETTSSYVFAEAVQYSADLVDEKLPLDGIVGMSFSELSRAKQPTLIDALHQERQLKERVFSFYLVSRTQAVC